MTESFGTYVKKLRGERTKKDIARDAGFTAEYVRIIEDENKIPSQDILVKLAKALGVGEKELVFRALQEKAPAEAKNFFRATPAMYLKTRNVLLGLYSENYGRLSTGYLSRQQMNQELEKYPFHLVEKKLLNLAFNRLRDQALIPPTQQNESAETYFNGLSELDFKETFKKAVSEWTYNSEGDFLIVGQDFGKGKMKFVQCRLSWDEMPWTGKK